MEKIDMQTSKKPIATKTTQQLKVANITSEAKSCCAELFLLVGPGRRDNSPSLAHPSEEDEKKAVG